MRAASYAARMHRKPLTIAFALDDIPLGRYAVQAYCDENGNGRLRRGLFGLPLDAIAF